MKKVDFVKEFKAVKEDFAKERGIELPKTKAEVAELELDSVFEAVRRLADKGEKVSTPIGEFSKVHKEATTARNPKTGEDVAVPEKDVLKHKHNTASKKAFVK
jgi:Bacterial nucleoid DNA-binding protein